MDVNIPETENTSQNWSSPPADLAAGPEARMRPVLLPRRIVIRKCLGAAFAMPQKNTAVAHIGNSAALNKNTKQKTPKDDGEVAGDWDGRKKAAVSTYGCKHTRDSKYIPVLKLTAGGPGRRP